MSQSIRHLAELIRKRNTVDAEIAEVVGRPAEKGHIGEFIASKIFGINLHESAAHRGSDGRFVGGPLDGKTVNIKYYGKQEGLLDINTKHPADFYLVLTGPRGAAASSVGGQRPFVIESAYLFDVPRLVGALRTRGVKIGVATSVAKQYWEEAEVFPTSSSQLKLNDEQRALLEEFSSRVCLGTKR